MKYFIIFTCLFTPFALFAQTRKDSTLYFEKMKGLLNHPLTHYKEVPALNVEEKYKKLLPKSVSYLAAGNDSVRAIFEGKIVSIAEVGGSYLVVMSYGDYSISYFGLSKPALKEGNSIKRNQFISLIDKPSFVPSFLTVQFYKGNIEVNPGDWFKAV